MVKIIPVRSIICDTCSRSEFQRSRSHDECPPIAKIYVPYRNSKSPNPAVVSDFWPEVHSGAIMFIRFRWSSLCDLDLWTYDIENLISSCNGVTKVGVTRCGNWWCRPERWWLTVNHRPTDFTVTARTLSAFPPDRLSSVLVNSSAKIFRLSLGCHPLDGVTRAST